MSDNNKAYYIYQSMGKHPLNIQPVVKIYAAPANVLKNYNLVYEYVFVKVFKICRRIANKYVSLQWSAMEDSTFLHLMVSFMIIHLTATCGLHCCLVVLSAIKILGRLCEPINSP